MESAALGFYLYDWVDCDFEGIKNLVMEEMTKLCFVSCNFIFESLYLALIWFDLMLKLFFFPIYKLFDFM